MWGLFHFGVCIHFGDCLGINGIPTKMAAGVWLSERKLWWRNRSGGPHSGGSSWKFCRRAPKGLARLRQEM